MAARSSFCFGIKLEWTELPPPEGYGSPAYKKIIPAGTVPAIQHEGISLADSEAISEYLNELYPDPPMLPSALVARAQAREISRFHDTRLEPVLRSFFGQVAPDQRNPEFIAAQATLLQERLDQLAVVRTLLRSCQAIHLDLPIVDFPPALPFSNFYRPLLV